MRLIITIIFILLSQPASVFCYDNSRDMDSLITTIDDYLEYYNFHGEIKFFEYTEIKKSNFEFPNVIKPNLDSLISTLSQIPEKPANVSYLKVWFSDGKPMFIKKIKYTYDLSYYEKYGSPVGQFLAVLGDTIEIFHCSESNRFVSLSEAGVDLYVSIYSEEKLIQHLYCCPIFCTMNRSGGNYKKFKIFEIARFDYYPETSKIKEIKEFFNFNDAALDKWYYISQYDTNGTCTFFEDNGFFGKWNPGKNKYKLSK